MSPAYDNYKRLTAELLAMREQTSWTEEQEDALLDIMDVVWDELTSTEIDMLDSELDTKRVNR